jgi:Ni,Fe-hydrogenase III large subunit
METAFLQLENGQRVDRADIPELPFEALRDEALKLVEGGAKVVQHFAYEEQDTLKLLTVLRNADALLAAGCDLPETYPSLTAAREPFHIFEREIAEQYGARPEGHPWLKMVRYHKNYRGKPDVFGNDYSEEIPGKHDYYAVEGDEIHEVAVGPVHAGVIEPGHFRFNCIGERVLNLEIHLGYQHRGIEPLLQTLPAARHPALVENIAGDTTVGHGLCYAQAIEALAGLTVEDDAKVVRSIGLELERIANHVGDLGALSGDVAFLPPANYCGRMRGDFLNMSLWLCGNRFGKSLVRPGGVGLALVDEDRSTVKGRLDEITPQVEHVIDLIFSTSSVRARFEGCGAVSKEDAEHLGLVGPAGRGCGLSYDVRRAFPTEAYAELELPEYALTTGDVYARAKVRADEVMQSIDLIQQLLARPARTEIVEAADHELAPSSLVVTLNEGWRGEVSHCLLTDAEGKIQRYKIKDPSFHNWNGLSMALRDTGISDFPLNNKSFNLSYCGYDL